MGLPLGIVLHEVKHGAVELASPRVVFPTVIWVFYLVLLAFRLVTGLRGKIPSYMAVCGFHAVPMSLVFELFLAGA
ncbi:hypothetical protein [Pseudodesulfovibrio indicus]|uniref:hypothetical protein n=1 Tax=Pseudodesulfovibrio indicus TaxID=1716143 RepID=UPI003747A227